MVPAVRALWYAYITYSAYVIRAFDYAMHRSHAVHKSRMRRPQTPGTDARCDLYYYYYYYYLPVDPNNLLLLLFLIKQHERRRLLTTNVC